MDTDESQSNSNSPPYVHAADGRILHHVLPFNPVNGNPSCNEINGNMNGKSSTNNGNSSSNNNNNNNDEEVSNLVNSDLSKNYASHHSQNSSHNNNLSKGPASPLYSTNDHVTNSRYPSVHNKLTHHATTRSPNGGHQISSSPLTSGSTNTPPPPPPCLFMIQSTGSTELLNHPHGSPLTAGVAVLASMPPVTVAGVPQSATGVNLPSLHPYALATNKRKTSFNFMPIDATVLATANNSHSQSSPPAPQHHHHHHHHQGLSIHNSPQPPPSTPTPTPMPMVTDMGQIHAAASIVTPSVIRGSVTQGPPTGVAATVTLPHSLGSGSGGPVVKNRDEKRRATHNEVERRRRDKINSWILKLSKLVPDCNSDQTKQGQSKGGILAKTCDYICAMEDQLRSCQRENQDLKTEIMVLRDKLSELESERHKLLSALTSTPLRESSPSSIESSSSTAVSAVSTSNQVSVAINSLFQPSASVNQVKQERAAAFHSVANTFASSSSNNHPPHHQHPSHQHHHIHPPVHTSQSALPSNDQMSVIVTVTSASCNVQQVHNNNNNNSNNLMSQEQLVPSVARESNSLNSANRASSSSSSPSSSSPPSNCSSSTSSGTTNDKLSSLHHGGHHHQHHHHHQQQQQQQLSTPQHHPHHQQQQHQQRPGEKEIGDGRSASGQSNVINSHVETHESNHEGLVNLKISSVLKSDLTGHHHDSSSPSSSSPVSINNDSSTSTPTNHVIHHSSPLDDAVNSR